MNNKQPLAFVLRPHTLEDVVGQQHLIGEGKILRKCVENNTLFPMIFYGPPGTGKTTLAMVLSDCLQRPYRLFNAVTGNKKELDAIFLEAKMTPGLVVIIDEVHRLNKDKQDLLLPHIENGNIILIGATTANPYHAINPAIRSRTHLFEIKSPSTEDIKKALQRAMEKEEGLHNAYTIEEDALHQIAYTSSGDIRYALNLLEICAFACDDTKHIDVKTVQAYANVPINGIDKDGDGHYNVLSAFQKSIRGSDVDAALYYLAILIEAGDMVSIERRLLTIAYEDIGLGNPAACARCVSAIDAAKRIGFPEGRIPLAHAVIDLCLSPKSKSAEEAIDNAMRQVHTHVYPMPEYLHFTPVGKTEEEKYDYSRSDLWKHIQYLPDAIQNAQYYIPQTNSQYEKVLADNLAKIKAIPRTNDLRTLKRQKRGNTK